MRMRGRKPIFGYKDTWSMDATLSPIICAGIKKFKEVITSDKNFMKGTPCDVLCELYPEVKQEFTEEQSEAGWQEWLDILDKMIYAFDNKEPDINEYRFEFVSGEDDGKGTEDRYFIHDKVPFPKEEYDRYRADEKEHEDRVKEGLSLFSTYFSNLWW